MIRLRNEYLKTKSDQNISNVIKNYKKSLFVHTYYALEDT